MASFREHIDFNRLPRHIAIIMDGNGRWARKKGAMRIFGHRNAVQSVREVTEGCAELGIPYLTLYAFSTENWGRPKEEVDGLMELLVHTLRQEINTLLENQIKLVTIGDIAQLPPQCQENIQWAIDKTKDNKGVTLILALSYSGRWEMTQAVKAIARDVESGKINPAYITEETIERYLATAGIPDPELLIRTSGEMRVSNFLLWQIAYTELYITPTLWPDFRKENLYEAIWAYQQRERRFGKTSEQLNPVN
ncbi:MAG: isoprenyl transferase [Cyclobacteriaceae bacterium]|nr:MAG: isoprenyl transferase [Cyclobacteriaceae bacterium]